MKKFIFVMIYEPVNFKLNHILQNFIDEFNHNQFNICYQNHFNEKINEIRENKREINVLLRMLFKRVPEIVKHFCMVHLTLSMVSLPPTSSSSLFSLTIASLF